MEIGEIISDSVKYPSSNWKKVLILGVFFILSAIIIGIPFVLGYFLRVIKSTIAGYDELPDFDEWGDMFVDGLKVLVVFIVYFIIPFIVIFAGAFASIAAISTAGSMADPMALFGLLGGTVIIGVILAFIFGLLAYIAIANMALYNEIGAAFKFSEILERISMIGWGKYIIWYIVIWLLGLVFGFVGNLLGTIIPFIGFIIAALVIYPYYYMFFGRALALIFASSEEGQPAAAPEEPAPAE